VLPLTHHPHLLVVKARSTPYLVREPVLTCRRQGSEAKARAGKYV